MPVDIRELNFENISIWPASIKAAVITFSCCLLFWMGYSLLLKTPLTDLKRAQQQAQALSTELASKQQLGIHLTVHRQQLAIMQQQFAGMLQQLPDDSEVPSLLDDIARLGTASGLEFTFFKPAPEQQLDFYTALPMAISVQGTYHQLAHFISQLSALNRIVTVTEFNISPLTEGRVVDNSPVLKMELMAATYRYHQGG